MCWYINKFGEEVAPKVHCIESKEDVAVYKIGFINKKVFSSYYHGDFSYKRKKNNNEIKLNLKSYGGINEGYHSYSENCYLFKLFNNSIEIRSDKDILNDSCRCGPYSKCEFAIGKFIIPKGSEYYENKDGEIVSSQLVWTGKSIPIEDIEYTNMINLKGLDYVLENR